MGGEWAEQRSYRNLLWIGRMEPGLHAIIVRIELEMCINFAQVYLRNGTAVSVVTLGFKFRSYYWNYGISNLWWTQSSLTKTLHRRQFIYYVLQESRIC